MVYQELDVVSVVEMNQYKFFVSIYLVASPYFLTNLGFEFDCVFENIFHVTHFVYCLNLVYKNLLYALLNIH